MPSIGQQPNPPTLLMVTLDTESPFSVRNYVWSGLNKTGALSCWSTLGCVKISPFVWIWLNGCQEDGGPGMSGLSVPGDSGDKVTRSLWHQWSGCCQLSEVGPPIRRSGCRLYWPIRGHRWVVWVVGWSQSPDPISQFCQILSAEMLSSSAACITQCHWRHRGSRWWQSHKVSKTMICSKQKQP